MSPHHLINHVSSSSDTSSLSKSSASTPPPSQQPSAQVQVPPIKGSNMGSMEVIDVASDDKSKIISSSMETKGRTSNGDDKDHLVVISKDEHVSENDGHGRRSPGIAHNIDNQTSTGINLSQSLRYCKLYELQLNRYRAKRLRFFINGDKFFVGMNYALNTEKIRSFDALLNDLTRLLADQISLSKGVRFIFDFHGQLVSTIETFEGGSIYLCSSIETFVPMEYNISHGKMNWLIRNSACITSAHNSRILRSKQVLNIETPYKNVNKSVNCGSPRSPISHPRNSANTSCKNLVDRATPNQTDSIKPNGVCTPTSRIQTPNNRTKVTQNPTSLKAKTPCSTKYSSANPIRTASQEATNNGILNNRTNQSRIVVKNSTSAATTKTPVVANKSIAPACNDNKKINDTVERPQSNSQQKSNNNDNNRANVMITTSRPLFPEEVTLKYDVGSPIGDGHFSVVYCCMNKSNQQFCALKLIDKLKCRGKEEMIYNEVNILKKLKHANIVTLIEEFDYPKQLYLILELVQDGDLFDAISTVTKFSEPDVATMIFNLSSALTYLHSHGIVHRDIKPENLLISVQEDGSQSVKLADFGLAVEVTGPLYTVCGTAFYVSPEMLSETGYEYRVDVWSTGIICFVLLCGYPPFSSENESDQDELFDAILAGEFTFASPYWDKISIYAKDLIRAMLTAEPQKRYSAEQVFNHPWTRGETTNFKGLKPMNISRTLTLQSVQL